MDEFEQQLHRALERMPAPPGLKRRVIERRDAQRAARRGRVMWWRRLALATAVICMLAGAWFWRGAQQRREGQEARCQVILALRITSRALTQMQSQLAAHNRSVLTREQDEQE
ncbi:MAG: hypothetical protein ACRD25_10795 [Terracidiphilus sp.]